MVQVKGNSGRGKRSRQMSLLMTVVIICASIIVLNKLLGFGRSSRLSKRYGDDFSGDNDARMEFIRDPKSNINPYPNNKKQKSDYNTLTNKQKHALIISGQVTLDSLQIGKGLEHSEEGDYDDVIGYFCQFDWSLHKRDPSKFPMFRDLEQKSNCKNKIHFDLKTAVQLIKEADENNDDNHDSHTLTPNGFVFHESRCGSTLAANALAAMNPSQTRVYSESTPPILAMKACGFHGQNCPKGTVQALLRDVIYLMGRTDDSEETSLFFKIQSIGTKYMDVLLDVFPTTPWIFIYRDPVHIMMSQLDHGVKNANCVRQLRDVPQDVRQRVSKENNGLSVYDLSSEQKCALHLSLLCESATIALQKSSYGKAVNYENIVNTLIQTTIPNHFNTPLTSEHAENILAVGSRYSKGRGKRGKEWKDDSKRKEDNASEQVKGACKMFLNSWYDKLETFKDDISDRGHGDDV